jgi:hypothetical protein
MPRPNAIYIDGLYATLAVASPQYGGTHMLTTCALREDRYVRIDDGRQYPQLCAGGGQYGNTLIYKGDDQLARDCRARLFKTRAGFDAAVARMED